MEESFPNYPTQLVCMLQDVMFDTSHATVSLMCF